MHLVWHTKSAQTIEWIRPLLGSISESLKDQGGTVVEIDIYVTRQCDWRREGNISEFATDAAQLHGLPVYTTAPVACPNPNVENRLSSFMRWNKGRADLQRIVIEDRERSEGPIHVSGKTGLRT